VLAGASPAEVISLAADQKVCLVDLRPALKYRKGHAAGAVWSIRPRLHAMGAAGRTVALFADEANVGALAAIDLAELGAANVIEVVGGFEAWAQAGLPVEATPSSPTDAEAIDHLLFVHDRHDGNLAASRQYLAWEQGLVEELDRDERAEFRLERPA
jgi:rhodanese-related sulfurtransferase